MNDCSHGISHINSLCKNPNRFDVIRKTTQFTKKYNNCAIVGSSGAIMNERFGEEIDSYDAVFRINRAPMNYRKYVQYIGRKTTN